MKSKTNKNGTKAAKFVRSQLYYVILVVSLVAIAGVIIAAIAIGANLSNPTVNKPIPPETKPSLTVPVKNEYTLDKKFALDKLLYSTTLKLWETHGGIDLKAERGAEVVSVLDGTVTKTGANDLDGTFVQITHADGYVSVYKSLDKELTVKEGDKVTKGQTIGKVSDTMLSEIKQGPHLHFEFLLNEKLVDPATFIEAIGGK